MSSAGGKTQRMTGLSTWSVSVVAFCLTVMVHVCTSSFIFIYFFGCVLVHGGHCTCECNGCRGQREDVGSLEAPDTGGSTQCEGSDANSGPPQDQSMLLT